MSSKDSIVPSEGRHDPDRLPMFSPQQFPGHEDAIAGIQQPFQAEQPHQSYSAAAFYTKESPTSPSGGDIQCRYTRESEQRKIVQRLMDSGQKFMTRLELDRLVDRAIETIETQERQLSDADDALFTKTHTNRSEERHSADADDALFTRTHTNGSDERHASQTSTVESDRYTISDAKNRRDPREFATRMLRTAQIAALTNVADQLRIIFYAIAPFLRVELTRPGPGSTVEGFLQELDGWRAKCFLRASENYVRRSQLEPKRSPSMSGYYFATYEPKILHASQLS